MATIRNKEISKTGGVCLSFVAVLAIAAATLFTSGKPVEELSENAAVGRKSVITAAGATLPLPFYSEAFKMYWEKNDIPVTYAGIGTERGFRSLKNQQIDFAGVDVPPTKAELDSLPVKSILVPTCMGAVTIAYNLEGVDNLRLTGELIADIYMGKILKWNDARIAAVNSGKQLPDKEIYPVFRLDGSGTTYIFSDYLTKVSTDWKAKIGTGKALTFPRGVAATGNTGVAGLVGKVPGAIGYVASEYAASFNTQSAWLKNAAGNFVQPTSESVTAAASVGDATGMITDSEVADAYPISCFTWVVLYKEQNYAGRSRSEAEETVKLLEWLISPEAQTITTQVQCSPLPEKAVEYAKNMLKEVTYDGKALRK